MRLADYDAHYFFVFFSSVITRYSLFGRASLCCVLVRLRRRGFGASESGVRSQESGCTGELEAGVVIGRARA